MYPKKPLRTPKTWRHSMFSFKKLTVLVFILGPSHTYCVQVRQGSKFIFSYGYPFTLRQMPPILSFHLITLHYVSLTQKDINLICVQCLLKDSRPVACPWLWPLVLTVKSHSPCRLWEKSRARAFKSHGAQEAFSVSGCYTWPLPCPWSKCHLNRPNI